MLVPDIVRFCIAHNRLVFLFIGLIAILALASISRLQVIIDPPQMLPPSHPYVQTM